MMQMLHAGGMPVLTDELRSADEDNPRGYFEFERVKSVKTDKAWLSQAPGKAVKIIHLLLPELPPDHEYRVIVMRRDLNEVVLSQAKMLERSGRRGAALAPEKLIAVFRQQLAHVEAWLSARSNFAVLNVEHASVMRDPAAGAKSIAAFVGGDLNVSAMASVVDAGLHRNRAPSI